MEYYLNMGEGIIGPSTIGLSTTQIWSCMGIAFVNRTSLRGGLYHYPATSLNNANVTTTIMQMINDCMPHEIVLTPAGGTVGNAASAPDDIAKVTSFLEEHGRVAVDTVVRVAPALAQATLTWKNDLPQFNAHLEDPDTQVFVNETMRKIMSTEGRELEGNCWYYGGDGDKPGVL